MGTFFFKQPRIDGRQYFVTGDPGTGAAPARNAPCIIVYDVTDAPATSSIVGFWWGNGGGSIMPFLEKLIEFIDDYRPIFAGIDNTGPQKSTAELISNEHIYGKNKSVPTITGLDFSGNKRYSYLVALRLSLEAKMIIWPSILSGISIQLKNYDPILDKTTGKLAQDIVATLAMGAFAIRAYYGVFSQEDGDQDQQYNRELAENRRYDRDGVRNRGRGELGSTATFPR